MSYDKVIDSAFLEDGLSAIADKIREKSGSTDNLVFPNGFVSAVDGIEGGGGEAEIQTMQKFVIDLSTVTKVAGILVANYWTGKTFYNSINNTGVVWQGFEGNVISGQNNASEAIGKYMTDEIKDNILIYITGNNSTALTIERIGLSSLASATKTYVEDYNGDFPAGTYEFVDGQIYYYTCGASSAPRAVSEKDINFYDYDGTLLYSYTLSQIQNLSQLPPLPTRAGLICQEWNWTLDELKALGRGMTVGASYITDDGATRIHIRIGEGSRMNVPLLFSQSVANGVTIDWGDGSATETKSGTGYLDTTHQYTSAGEYTISLMPLDSCTLVLGKDSGEYGVLGSLSSNTLQYQLMLEEVNIGKNVNTLGARTFKLARSLKTITIPKGVTTTDTSVLNDATAIGCIIFPNGLTTVGSYIINRAYALKIMSLPPTFSKTSTNMFQNGSALTRVDLPSSLVSLAASIFDGCCSLRHVFVENATTIGNYCFQNCFSLQSVKLNDTVSYISTSAFSNCYGLTDITFPKSLTSINASAFSNCYSMTRYDFTKCTAVPTLGNTNVFTGIPEDCIIVVPDNLLASWKTATNWSTYASHIKGASEV